MTPEFRPLFDFAPFHAARTETVELIRRFAAHEEYRSAVVDELELDEDYYRRPLRPEDLGFLKFDRPVAADNASQLPALAANRLLLSINELDVARLPRSRSPGEFERFAAFYSDDNRVLGARVRPFLENHSFAYLAQAGADTSQDLRAIHRVEEAFWGGVFDRLQSTGYLMEGLRFALIQTWCLLASKRSALARAAASGCFGVLSPEQGPNLAHGAQDDELANRLAGMCGVARQAHSYWQFYLPTSLAQTNLLYALAARPDRAFALCGAAFVAEAQWLAFNTALRRACPHMVAGLPARAEGEAGTVLELFSRAANARAVFAETYGSPAVAGFAQGQAAAEGAAASSRRDMGEHFGWLTSIRDYVRHARAIHDRILAECPDIDRETFVEPREMCSTTHVHDDNRLVVIESGDMVFWGNLGMQHAMKPGDMILIPAGRLHGSTVVSDECVYHQPIIPDAWIAELMNHDNDKGRAFA